MILNLTSGEIQEYPCKTPFSPLFGPFPNTAGSDLYNCQVYSQNTHGEKCERLPQVVLWLCLSLQSLPDADLRIDAFFRRYEPCPGDH